MKRFCRFVLPFSFALAACVQAPTYLRTHGYVGDHEAVLGWILLLVSLAVIAIVTLLVLLGSLRGNRRGDPGETIQRTGAEFSWIVIGGIVVPVIVLVVLFVYSMTVLNAVAAPTPASTSALTLRVIGHQWWWEVRYVDGLSGDSVVTANEIHLPVGQRVRIELEAADVIHSFWVPELAGKTDLIPGQRNLMWLQADTTGTYWSQCAEYCGLQHAKMGLVVQAESPVDFSRWLSHQREPAPPPASDDQATVNGREVFTHSACTLCHTIRGTEAAGRLGPDLTHLANRRMIAAGLLPNTPGYLSGWVANPQAIKPGSGMPAVELRPAELQAVVHYLESLH